MILLDQGDLTPPFLAEVLPVCCLPPPHHHTASITSIKLTGPSGAPLLATNSSANLSCAASGGPVSQVTWTKDGQPVAPGPRMTFTNNKTMLKISPLQPEDNGVFSCQLRNDVSSKAASFNMEVYCE